MKNDIDKQQIDSQESITQWQENSENTHLWEISQLTWDYKKHLLQIIKLNPNFIRTIENPSIEVQLSAVQADWNVIQYIENPSEEVQLAAIDENPEAIKYIKDPTEKVLKEAFILSQMKNSNLID